MDKIKYYAEEFNRYDEETIRNDVDNAHAEEWMRREVPYFECPDADVERAYYFRFWTYRKHVKTTNDGVVITEFLPKVGWSGEHNTINAAVGHHLYEGRWLRHAERYLDSYIRFFLTVSKRAHSYSAWLADAIYKYASVRGKYSFCEDFVGALDRYYRTWEETHGLPDGSFWSIDDRDAMEFSVSGTDERLKTKRGVRPTLNSYMCADSLAISLFAEKNGDGATADAYMKKHLHLKRLINERLFEDGFYRAYHYYDDEEPTEATEKKGSSPRELIGYIPFMFDIPEAGREECFELLMREEAFFSEYGLTTVERSNERYLYPVDHECLWNGYVWPFATSQTLTALKNVASSTGDAKYKEMFCTLLSQYARMHKRVRGDGVTVSWIDEVMDPRDGDWYSRTNLKEKGWRHEAGGYERGKDYNHSTFCDLVISGICGVSASEGQIKVEPIIPEAWEYFRLTGVVVCGREYDIIYDKHGTKYGEGCGLTVREIKHS
ncbi:MAG: hypothetical protein IKV40_00785 [Clostridia bacterium]|nr:hypothetical protein [Clostridia bacterium]